MTNHGKKMIAPIVIAVLIILYFIAYFILFFVLFSVPLWVKLLAAIVPLLLGSVTIAVLVQRIKEIRSCEEDDLSQY